MAYREETPPGGWTEADKVPEQYRTQAVKETVIPPVVKSKPPWEMTEAEYVKAHIATLIRRYEKGIEYEQAELDRLSAKQTAGRHKREITIKFWRDTLTSLKDTTSRKYQVEVESAKTNYGKVVRKAISTGRSVPDNIIEGRLDFRTARTARERYEKGKHTSFANRSIAIDEQMKEERGYKVKRQDGKPIMAAQIAEIGRGVDDIEQVLGPLHDLFEKTDITIAHTSGKHPFMTGYGGLYSVGERTVTMGEAVTKALGHEVAHWLDHEAGEKQGIKKSIYSRSGKRIETTSLAEAQDDRFQHGDTLTNKARRKMKDSLLIRRSFSEGSTRSSSAEQYQAIKVAVGPYWNSGVEIWARLVEQYIATKIGKAGEATSSPEYYHKTPGWWPAEDFKELTPDLEVEIKKRIRQLRGSDTIPARQKPTKAGEIVKQADQVAKVMADTLSDKDWEAFISKMGQVASTSKEHKYSIETLRRLHGYHGQRSVMQDVRKRAKVIVPLRNAQKWLRNPNRYDIVGVDTPSAGTIRDK